MAAELTKRPSGSRRSKEDARTYGNLAPSKRSSIDANGNFRIHKDALPEAPRLGPAAEKSDRQVSQLRQQVQVLELQMLASDRVRQHLEASLREMNADLDNFDGSAQSVHAYRAKLSRENSRLAELLQEEAQARRAAEAEQMDGVKAMWSKFQSTMNQERDSYSKLEESRKALLAQQRTTQTELEDQRRQVQELLQSRKRLQAQLAEMTDRVELEVMAKNDEGIARRRLQGQLQDLEAASSASNTVNSEYQEAAAMWKSKAESYLARIEAAEVGKVKADRGEAHIRRTLEESQRALADTAAERKGADARISELEQHIQELERKLEEDSREFSDMELFRQRLAEEMEDERHQHQKDLAERDFSIDQTRKKYQAELAQLSEEMLHEREKRSRLSDEIRRLKSEHDELQLRYDDEVYSGSSWKKEKERLEAKIGDLISAYEASNGANAEQQSQIVSLLSQVRELRAHLDEADAERAALQQARRTLEGRLSDIAQDHLDTSKMSSDRVLQALNLEKQDLRSALEEQLDKVAMANERFKKAETFANEYQVELSKIRAENSELDRINATLDKQVKDLNVRIVDLETRSFAASSPRATPTSRRLETRVEELQSKLNQESKEKTDTIRLHRTAERDTKFQLVEAERQRARLEEKVQDAEVQVQEMRQAFDNLQTDASELQLAKRRAEREAGDAKQRALQLERELERLRSRLDRPSSVVIGSPAPSPRK
ncbi:hypothetical protein BKA62DRAFT_84948 [Auriculariales sp. MPI-PUGE-AT-0066]|nr:hypothetical protein BKA62DRAFT_84948 [Auriculariales sp. MPI-PUGE-AT-0066]